MTPDTDRSSQSACPPRWAEAALRLLLPAGDAEAVTGDLIEEYRESVYPSRSRWRADLWYVRQVMGFVSVVPLTCGLVLAAFLCVR